MGTFETLGHLTNVVIWGLIATAAMTTLLEGSQALGLSRLSLPFLAGTFFTTNRRRAVIVGFIVYLIGGWLFGLLYFVVFFNIGIGNLWLGAILGFLHGLFLLLVALPFLPYVHPHIATEYDGPTATRRLEPPGFLGLNYGRRTPLTTLVGQVVYGAILGFGYAHLIG